MHIHMFVYIYIYIYYHIFISVPQSISYSLCGCMEATEAMELFSNSAKGSGIIVTDLNPCI